MALFFLPLMKIFVVLGVSNLLRDQKGQLKQGEAFPSTTHTENKIKLFLYKWCFTTQKIEGCFKDQVVVFLFLCFSKVYDI